jgi:hypothetical protein
VIVKGFVVKRMSRGIDHFQNCTPLGEGVGAVPQNFNVFVANIHTNLDHDPDAGISI